MECHGQGTGCLQVRSTCVELVRDAPGLSRTLRMCQPHWCD